MSGGGVSNREEWRVRFEAAIRPLALSVTASRYGLPQLDNAAFRNLAREAKVNLEAAQVLREYYPSIQGDVDEVIGLIVEHPDVGDVFDGEGERTATFVTMPGHGFRVELRQVAERIARIAVIRGEAAAAMETDEFLALAGRGQLPGFEVAVVRGLAVDGAVELAPGTFVTTYGDAVARGLAKKREPEPLGFGPDHEADGASVVCREMTWRPCLVGPQAANHKPSLTPKPSYAGKPGPALSVVLDSLSVVMEQRVELVEIYSCAPAFTDINLNFAPGSSTWFTVNDQWRTQQLTSCQALRVGTVLEAWTGVRGRNRSRLELGLARLASSIRRNRGRFPLEDRILDVAVALEVLYGLEGGELTHKLSTRAAYLLGGDSPEKRVEVYDRVQELYRARSSIVHGRKRLNRKERGEAQKAAESGFEIGRDTLVELLRRRVEPDWKRVTLSAK